MKGDKLSEPPPVTDWVNDFNHFDARWAEDPFVLWDEMRAQCPIATTQRNNGFFFPTTWDALRRICFDTEHFSSRSLSINATDDFPPNYAPPLTADPPKHRSSRRLLMSAFSPAAIDSVEAHVLAICKRRLAAINRQRRIDAALDFARHVNAGMIAALVGLSDEEALSFQTSPHETILSYVQQRVTFRRDTPGDDLITKLLATCENGTPLDDDLVVRTIFLIIAVGGDTVRFVTGASLWHLATHPEDLARLIAEPHLIAAAVEEFLRCYSPVTSVRVVHKQVTVNGCFMAEGQRVLLAFAAANRDPEKFTEPDRFIINRPHNRHATFGLGIHRCIAENLARRTVTMALRQWLHRIPDFTLDTEQPVVWTTGHFRGPTTVPLLLAQPGT